MSAKLRRLVDRHGEETVACVVEAASKTAFAIAFRRAEISVKVLEELNILRVMSRACIRWFDHDKREIPPETEALKQLYEQRHLGGFAEIEIKTSKADQHGDRYGHCRGIAPLTGRKNAVDPGDSLLRYEMRVPRSNKFERENTFIFSFPDGAPLETSILDEYIMHLVWRIFQVLGCPRTVAEVKKLYSLHSFRIGALNAYRLGGMDQLKCMVAGRWTSASAARMYIRSENDEMINDINKAMQVDAQFNQTIAPDLPAYPLARALPPGTAGVYAVRPTDELDQGETPSTSFWSEVAEEAKEQEQIAKTLAHELNAALGMEVAKKFAVPLASARGRKRNEFRFWKGQVISIGEDRNYPVKVKFEPNSDGSIDYEEWDLDAFRKGREAFRIEYESEDHT